MAFENGPKTVTNGLVLSLDAADRNSYPGSGATWRDMSASPNNASLINSPSFSTNNGGYLTFDNSTKKYAQLGSGFADFTSGITIESWVYPTDNSIYHRIMDFSSGPNVDNIMLTRWQPTSACAIALVNSGNVFISLLSTTNSYTINQWQNWVGIINGTNWLLYKNGELNNSTANTLLPRNATRTLNYIGAGPFGSNPPNEFHTGHIAIIKIYNRGLSAAEVLQNYNAQKSRFGL